MANANELQAKIASGAAVVRSGVAKTLDDLLRMDTVKKRFEELLGANAAGFVSSLLSLKNNDKNLVATDPRTILSAGMMAATLDLPVNKNLGFAWIIPYKGKAEFQMGWKGYVQLAIRTGQYKTIHASEIYADEIESWNAITGEIKFTPEETWKMRDAGQTEKIVGFVAFFRLINGFEKYLYMTTTQMERHAKRYSQSYSSAGSKWKSDPVPMGLKTVIKLLLSKFGILSIKMQQAVSVDQGVIRDSITLNNSTVDPEADFIDVVGTPDEGAPAPAVAETTGTNDAMAGTAQDPA